MVQIKINILIMKVKILLLTKLLFVQNAQILYVIAMLLFYALIRLVMIILIIHFR